MNYRISLTPIIVCLIIPTVSFAGPLTQAHVTKVINDVKLVDPAAGERTAKLDDIVHDEIALTTGTKSRSELLFQDNTLTRLGPESYFSFKTGTRDMTLQKGTMLLQVPKGLGGAKIHTAAITAAITGTTIMMEYVPGKDIKVLVLEGTLRLSINGRFGDSLLLTPGRMIIMSPGAKRIPDPVTVDLKKVVSTSTLVNMSHGKHKNDANAEVAPLPSMALIEKEISHQQTGKGAHNLIDTNLVILGKGTSVLLGSDSLMADLATRDDVAKVATSLVRPIPIPVATPAPTPNPTPNPAPTPNPNPPPTGTPTPPPSGTTYSIDNTTTITTQNTSATITTQGLTTSGVIYKDVSTNGSPSAFLFGSTSVFDNQFGFDNFYLQNFHQSAVFTFDSLQLGDGIVFSINQETNSVALVGNNGLTNSPGSIINLAGIQNILFATQTGNIALDSGISFITGAGGKAKLVEFYARGGDLDIGAAFTLPNSNLQFAAENNAVFGGVSTITTKNLTVTGLQTVQFDGNATVSSIFQLNGGSVELGGTVTSPSSFLYGSSATINGTLNSRALTANLTGDFLLNNSGALNLSDNSNITSATNITLNGTTSVQKLTLSATNAIAFGGTLTSTDTVTATSASETVNGSMNAHALNFQPTGTFLLANTGNITATNDSTINAGGAVELDGVVNSPNANFKITGIGTGLNPAVVVNGAETAKSFDFETTGDFLLNASGAINATGDSKINASNGAITVDGSFTTANLNLTASGDVDVNQTLTASHLTVTGQTDNIAATITAHDVDLNPTADLNLTAAGSFNLSGHLHVNASGNVVLDGLTNATNDVQINANNAVTVNGALTTTANFNSQASSIAIDNNIIAQSITFQTSTFTLANTGSLTAGHDIQVNNAMSIALDGTVDATNNLNLTATGDVEIGDSTQAGNATIHSGTLTLNGNLTAATTNLQLSTGLNLGAAGSLVSAQNLSITVPTPFTFNTIDSTITRFDPTNLSSLTINAPSIVLPDVTTTNSVTINTANLMPQSTNTLSINAPNISFQGNPMMNGQNGTPLVAPGNAFNLTLNTNDFTLSSALSLNGGDGDVTVADAGGDGGQLNITGHNITLNAPVNATSGQSSNSSLTGGNGGTVNLTASNTVSLNNKIEASSNDGNRRRSSRGGNINVTSTANGGTAISVSSSAQLLALLNAAAPGPGGSIKLVSAGGNINMSGTAQADRGTVEITNNGSGAINLTNATLAADTVKVGALGNGGTLNIGGGTISADSIIKLYAGGSNGTVDFTGNVTLSGNSAKTIAANTVTINNDVVVTILGLAPANVYTNNPNYSAVFGGNGHTTGTFAGKGANLPQPFSSAPGY